MRDAELSARRLARCALHRRSGGDGEMWMWEGRMMWGSEVPGAVEDSATAGERGGRECWEKGTGIYEDFHDGWGFDCE